MLRIDPAKRPNVNEILSTPLLQKRIAKYLSETVRCLAACATARFAGLPFPARFFDGCAVIQQHERYTYPCMVQISAVQGCHSRHMDTVVCLHCWPSLQFLATLLHLIYLSFLLKFARRATSRLHALLMQ